MPRPRPARFQELEAGDYIVGYRQDQEEVVSHLSDPVHISPQNAPTQQKNKKMVERLLNPLARLKRKVITRSNSGSQKKGKRNRQLRAIGEETALLDNGRPRHISVPSNSDIEHGYGMLDQTEAAVRLPDGDDDDLYVFEEVSPTNQQSPRKRRSSPRGRQNWNKLQQSL